MERMSRWGVGPNILMTALYYIVVSSTVTHHWPDVCRIRAVPHRVFQVVGVLLLAIGVPLLVLSLNHAEPKIQPGSTSHGGHL